MKFAAAAALILASATGAFAACTEDTCAVPANFRETDGGTQDDWPVCSDPKYFCKLNASLLSPQGTEQGGKVLYEKLIKSCLIEGVYYDIEVTLNDGTVTVEPVNGGTIGAVFVKTGPDGGCLSTSGTPAANVLQCFKGALRNYSSYSHVNMCYTPCTCTGKKAGATITWSDTKVDSICPYATAPTVTGSSKDTCGNDLTYTCESAGDDCGNLTYTCTPSCGSDAPETFTITRKVVTATVSDCPYTLTTNCPGQASLGTVKYAAGTRECTVEASVPVTAVCADTTIGGSPFKKTYNLCTGTCPATPGRKLADLFA